MNHPLIHWLSLLGNVSSVIGLIATLYTLYKVASLPAALKQHSRDKQLTEMIDRINRLPAAKPKITDSNAREVEMILKTIRLYYVSRWPFRNRTLRSLLDGLERELKGEKHREVVQHQLRLIRDEITIR